MWFEIPVEADKTAEHEVSTRDNVGAELRNYGDEVSDTEASIGISDLAELRGHVSSRRMVTDGPFAETKH
jgi:hypothetical protein